MTRRDWQSRAVGLVVTIKKFRHLLLSFFARHRLDALPRRRRRGCRCSRRLWIIDPESLAWTGTTHNPLALSRDFELSYFFVTKAGTLFRLLAHTQAPEGESTIGKVTAGLEGFLTGKTNSLSLR